jgi:DNA-binding transcriptional LysR family regulator
MSEHRILPASGKLAVGSFKTKQAPAALAGVFDDLNTLRIFVRTVETGNYSEVARRIGTTPAMVSKRIAGLEAKLGQRLLNRNTRRLVVTEIGQLLYDHAIRALHELEDAVAEMTSMQSHATGNLRITAPAMLGNAVIAPRLAQFSQQNPGLSIDITLAAEKLDLYEDRIDIAVRIADSIDPGFVAIKLAPYSRVFCAAPAYLESRRTPSLPDELMDHNCLITRGSTLNARWPVKREGGVEYVPVRGNLTSNSGPAIRLACLAGLGIMMAPRWLVSSDLASGQLVEVLPGLGVDNRAVYAVLLQRSDLSAKLQIAVEFLRECFVHMR